MTEHSKVAVVPAGAKMVSIEATIRRAKVCPDCGVSDGNPFDAEACAGCGAHLGDVQSAEEPQGVIAYWHRNPLWRAGYRFGRLLGRAQALLQRR